VTRYAVGVLLVENEKENAFPRVLGKLKPHIEPVLV
jgi:hypothetical protein